MTAETYQRSFALTGCGNFRDLGGYATADGRSVKWRTLFRSDALHQLNDEDIDVLSGAGVNLAVGFDLRSEVELLNTGPGGVYERGARHVHVPMIQVVAIPDQVGQMPRLSYVERLQNAQQCVSEVFSLLANGESYPAVFYCAAGKDRTGIMAALILRTLGVQDEQIIEDYSLTQPMSEERRAARMRELGWTTPLDPKLYEAVPDAMVSFLNGLDEQYGSVEAYLEFCGVGAATVEQMRAHLLD